MNELNFQILFKDIFTSNNSNMEIYYGDWLFPIYLKIKLYPIEL